jgi:hypothetical protein
VTALPVSISDEFIDVLAARVADVVLERLELKSRNSAPSPWLDAAGVAEYTSMSIEGIRAATKRGQLKSHRSTTARVRYRREDVDAFLRGEG